MDLSILSWLCLHTGEPGCSHRREHAFSAYFTWHVICTGAWCVYGYTSTSKPNYVTFCMCAKINTTRAGIRNLKSMSLSLSNKQVAKYFEEHFPFHFNAKSDTSGLYASRISVTHTHSTYLLTLPRCHTALLHARYQVRSGPCHLIAPWLAFGKRPSEGFICCKILPKKKKNEWRDMSVRMFCLAWVWADGVNISPRFPLFSYALSFLTTYVWH